jgi:hypothetical protein
MFYGSIPIPSLSPMVFERTKDWQFSKHKLQVLTSPLRRFFSKNTSNAKI